LDGDVTLSGSGYESQSARKVAATETKQNGKTQIQNPNLGHSSQSGESGAILQRRIALNG